MLFSRSKGVILVYHGIEGNDRNMNVKFAEFKTQIMDLKEKYLIVSIEDLLVLKHGTKMISIVFDDSLQDSLLGVMFLEENEIHYSIAIIHNRVNEPGYMRLNTLVNLKYASFLFHTNSHKNLVDLTKEDILKELIVDDKYSFGPTYSRILVYPFGKYNKNVVRISKQLGFEYALTLLPFHITDNSPHMELPRININGNVTKKRFEMIPKKIGRIYYLIAFIKRKILFQSYLE